MSSEPLRCSGALIVDDHGRIFIQRRSSTRRLFPDAWDIVGGHVEADETLDEALRREVAEETGWALSHVLATVGQYAYRGEDGVERLETDFLVRVDGDLAQPRLEEGKHTESRWITEAEVAVLDEQRDTDDGLMRRIVSDGFALLHDIGVI